LAAWLRRHKLKGATLDFRPIERAAGAFQQSMTAEEIFAICRRGFGPRVRVLSAVELGHGMYNSTYRVTLAEQDQPVILRVAPEPSRQFSSERELMRNEYASVPYLAPIAPLMPRVIMADFTHEVVARDYMVHSFLNGVPAPEHLGGYPRAMRPSFFRQLGAIARDLHMVRGPHFGPVSGPAYTTWGKALTASLNDIAADLDSAGLEATDVRKVAAVANEHRAILDAVTEPRMLSGDLWTVNVMLAVDAQEPMITGVLDMDRTWWGDPAADWTIRMAQAKSDERVAFWETYGELGRGSAVAWRSRIYEARHLGAIRLERHRLGNPEVKATYDAMAAVLADLI
jgi:aminoglycoside phosphotransferase (APT) family kinase protein